MRLLELSENLYMFFMFCFYCKSGSVAAGVVYSITFASPSINDYDVIEA